MSELKASTVTDSKIKNINASGVLDNAPIGATHYDMFWYQFLKVNDKILRFYEDKIWKISNHKDGVAMIGNGECINLLTKEVQS